MLDTTEKVLLFHTSDPTYPELDGANRVGFEDEDYFDHRWWSLADVATTPDRCYPGRLPGLLVRFLAGDDIDEPFERWS